MAKKEGLLGPRVDTGFSQVGLHGSLILQTLFPTEPAHLTLFPVASLHKSSAALWLVIALQLQSTNS